LKQPVRRQWLRQQQKQRWQLQPLLLQAPPGACGLHLPPPAAAADPMPLLLLR
jgi:hypothetical protein